MEFKVVEFKKIHWDGFENINPLTDDIKVGFDGDVFVARDSKFPIMLECNIRIYRKNDLLASAIYRTKCLLTFKNNSDHYVDIQNMVSGFAGKVGKEWLVEVEKTTLKGFDILQFGKYDAIRSLSIQIWERAKAQQLF